MRIRKGATLLEVTMSAMTISVVGIAASLGIRNVTEVQEQNRIRIGLISAAHGVREELAALAHQGTLSTTLNVTRDITLGQGQRGQIIFTTRSSGEAPNLVLATITVRETIGFRPLSYSFDTGFFNFVRPRIVGVRFHTGTLPSNRFGGLIPSANWNFASGGSATNLDSNFGTTTLDFSSNVSTITLFASNLVNSGTNRAGDNVREIYAGALWNPGSGADHVSNLTQIPYARYDLLIYVQVPNGGTGNAGTIRLGGGSPIPLPLPAAGALARQVFREGENVIVFRNLSGASQTITLAGSPAPPPLHALQVVERR